MSGDLRILFTRLDALYETHYGRKAAGLSSPLFAGYARKIAHDYGFMAYPKIRKQLLPLAKCYIQELTQLENCLDTPACKTALAAF